MPIYILTSHGTFSGAEDFAYGMQKARELALRAQRKAATTTQGQHQADYLPDELAAQQPPKAPPVSVLQQYAGMYGPLTLYLAENQLFCKNSDAGNAISVLRHIAGNRFVLDDNAHVEFMKDSEGRHPLIKLFVSDGNVFEERRKGLN
jgi:hypothetical protein